MESAVVLVGVGEMGGVFARGLLRAGHPVFPVLRGTAPEQVARALPDPALVLVAVAEGDLHPVLERVPAPWRTRLGLLQNELLPRAWEAHHLARPTVAAVWFEKKPGQDVKVILSSPVAGPRADLLVHALQAIGVAAHALHDDAELLFELVRKNLYILTSNIAGLLTGGTVGELWDAHHGLALEVADEVLAVQGWLTGRELPRAALLQGLAQAFAADPQHGCTGRSAPRRLARAIRHADEAGLAVPRLRAIHAGT